MKNFFHSKYNIVLLIFSLVFFVLYNYLNFSVPGIFNSPDETANFVFTQTIAKEHKLSYRLPNDYGALNEFIHPRSTFVEEVGGDEILPVGFWGMPALYGIVAKSIGTKLVVFLTSILAIFGVWAFYGIIKKIFSEQISFWSSVLLFFQPVLWYYTGRSMFHNVGFVSLVLMGVWLLISKPIKKYIWSNDILGMVIFMLGILMRPNEIVWIVLCICIVVIMYRKEISFSRLLTWVIIGLLFVGLYGWINIQVYGSSAGSYISSRSLEVRHWYSFIFPFGIDIEMILKSGWFYFVKMFWWFSIPALFGFCLFIFEWIKKRLTKEQIVFGIVFILASLFLFVYYGSNHDTLFDQKTIGVAYTRYWLPLFVASTIFVVFAYFWLLERISYKRFLNILGIISVIISFVYSAKVVYGGIDGLDNTKDNLLYAYEVKTWVLANTKEDVIIITDHEDKFFWPERQVIVRFFDSRVGEAVQKLAQERKIVYYFCPRLDDVQRENVYIHLRRFGLGMGKIMDFQEHELYIIRQ